MASLGRQFILLFWKNLVLQKRKVCVTAFEIGTPVFFAIILVFIRILVKSEYIDNPTTWSSFTPTPSTIVFPDTKKKLFYTPNTATVTTLMQTVQTATGIQTIQGFDSESAMESQYRADDFVWAGVAFGGGDYTSGLPSAISYKLRVTQDDSAVQWETELTYPVFARSGYRDDSPNGGEPYYYTNGFLMLQYEIDKAIIETKNSGANLGTDYAVYLQKMAFPATLKDDLLGVLRTTLPLFIILSFILNAMQMTRDIAYEKEMKLKESMKMMGLSTFIYWLSWFVKNLLYLTLVMILYTIFCSISVGDNGKILNYTTPSLFFIFLFMYGIATISLCFMISTFFHRATTATFAAGLLFFFTYFPYFFLSSRYADMSTGEKLASCLLSNVAMAFGCNVISIYEGTGEGAQWNNFSSPGTVDDNFSFLQVIIMLLVDSILYMLIAWYVDKVNPGEFGVRQPLYFPFKPSYWCGRKPTKMDDLSENDQYMTDSNFERDPVGMEVGISIRGLRKVFKSAKSGKKKKVAVNNMNLNMFEGQITSLLGHNGAGKTTTMSMLTGFLQPTEGTAIINGYDITTDIDSVRKNLGLCPQHNILFDSLTVEEHLEFFSQLKGCPKREVKAEVDKMIEVLGLEKKRKARSSTLSGGQKRKLSVGIALIAGSKTVMLDEPTSGMDPLARRQTWDILQKYREGRTIILTTHFMDEADILGDRIAIMSDGVVKCCGTSMFLKKLYGAGYHLVLVKDKSASVDRITNFVCSLIPTATLESEISAEVSYLLPFDQLDKFAQLFRELETKMKELGITSFGASATTMEEVFLKVGENTEDDDEDTDNSLNTKDTSPLIDGTDNRAFTSSTSKLPPINLGDGDLKISYSEDGTPYKLKALDPSSQALTPAPVVVNGNAAVMTVDAGPSNSTAVDIVTNGPTAFNRRLAKNTGLTLMLQQFRGMFVKKAIHTWRNKIVTLVQLLLPVVFTILALLTEKTTPKDTDEPSLALDLGKFEGPKVAYSDGTTATTATTDITNLYKGQFSATESVDRVAYTTMDNYFVAKAESIGISTFNNEYIVAADIQDTTGATNVTAHFNDETYHGVAISLAYIMNALQMYFTTGASITTTNHPFPLKISESTDSYYSSITGIAFSLTVSILFGMAIMITTFIMFTIKERVIGSKHLQVVSGVGSGAFWLSNFLWDIVNYTIPVLIILIVFAAFQTEAYVYGNRLGLVLLVFMLYGWSALPFIYIFHFLFKTAAGGMTVVSMINLLTGVGFLIVTFALGFPGLSTEKIADALEWVFIIISPNYNLGISLMEIYNNWGYRQTCENQNYKAVCALGNVSMSCCFPDNCGGTCFTFKDNYLDWESPGIGRSVTFMVLQGFVFLGILFLIESGLIGRLMYSMSKTNRISSEVQYDSKHSGVVVSPTHRQEDSDVATERDRINTTSLESLLTTDSLLLKNVHKSYGGFRAVNGISVGVPSGECFGLLGQNGAGKTTTFKMLTGDVTMTSGHAYLSSFSVKSHLKEVQQNLGYCPQFDALIDQMTGRETLTMYARLRGVKEDQIDVVVNELIEILLLKKHADKQTVAYSGGNKRKLSTAIALIGDPPFIFLDEPTTGVDPGARRQLWNVLSDVRASGRTLVLTSHSMEECDALCTKIVIMVNGKFVCLGSPQHLKNKFGQGYTLMCRMGFTDENQVAPIEPVIAFVKNNFPSSQIFDDQQGYVHFQIPDQNVKLAQVFDKMEEAKFAFKIDDYSVHQTTLEQIFLTFTRNQVPPEEKKSKGCPGMFCCCR